MNGRPVALRVLGRHLTSIADLSDADIQRLLASARAMSAALHDQWERLDGSVISTAFFEPSTRTRLSFEAAAHRLGADVVGFSDPGTTSSSKGETLEDTTRMLGGYSDLIVMRHPKEGAALAAAKVSPVPVVNAGDGPGEHPTQTLVDLFTIQEALGRLKGVKVAVVGDLKFGRTVHSLVPALRRLGADAVQVPAAGLSLPSKVGHTNEVTLDEAAADCDVLYVTRVQKERFHDAAEYERVKGSFVVGPELLTRNKSRAIVLHPLPRVDEIPASLDALPAAKYFDQARNGVPVRMAVLSALLEKSS